jgi:GNAT superfamily N-acetyltransferase
MEPAIRPAAPGDAQQIARLLTELGYPQTAADQRPRLERWAADPHGRVLVAPGGAGDLAGVVALSVVPYLEREGAIGRIVALVVDARVRGRGVGRALIDAAQREAELLGCVTLEVNTQRHRDEARAFYRRLGFAEQTERSVRFMRAL